MANITKEDVRADIASTLGTVASLININDTQIGYAAAAGVGTTAVFPTVDAIAGITARDISGVQVRSAIEAYVIIAARTLRFEFNLTGNTASAGTKTYAYGYVPQFQPIASQLTPTAPATYDVLNAGRPASRTLMQTLLENLRVRVVAHADINIRRVNYCHTNCHSNCHSSRGRR